MVNQQILSYLRRTMGQYGLEASKKALQQQGYSPAEVEEAARMLTGAQPAAPPGSPAAVPAAAPTGISMGKVVTAALIAGAAGALVKVLILSIADFLNIGDQGFVFSSTIFTFVVTIIFALLAAIAVGQWGAKIAPQKPLWFRAMLVLILIDVVVTLVFNLELITKFFRFFITVIAIALGAFVFGKLLEKRVPDLA